MRNAFLFVASLCFLLHSACLCTAQEIRPNVLFIAIDDLNDWIGCLGGHPQTITPNLDRLAKSSVLFTNAHCAAPACNPSRSAIMTGVSPHVSGIYTNAQKMREVLPNAELIPKTFSRNGYFSAGSGKMLHYFIDAASWDEYFPNASTENPFPRTLLPKSRPVSLPVGGPWQYVETDWGALDASDEEAGGDYLVTEWVGKQLSRTHEKPFFLACGIYRPHEPWFVPKEYFEPFPLESIQLPPGYREDDLDDVPEPGKTLAQNRYFPHIVKEGHWKKGIQGYLASIHYSDAMLGRVLDALEKGPNAKNTIVVLWSDHGWHLGEKQHWQKYTGWRLCTRIPLMIQVPQGTPGLPAGTLPSECDQPVSLLSLFPTLLQLCGLEKNPTHDGPSLVPLLNEPNADWGHVALTYLADGNSCSVSDRRYRLIRYENGDEELYDDMVDRYEWKNLSGQNELKEIQESLRKKIPSHFAENKKPSVTSLTQLDFRRLKPDEKAPVSKPDGTQFQVFFRNETESPVNLYWIDRDGTPVEFGQIASTKTKSQQTRPGAVWMISTPEGKPMGYFQIGDRSAQAAVTE